MTNFFISSIYDKDIYLKTPNVSYKNILDYDENKSEIITFNYVDIGNDNTEEFEIIDKDDIQDKDDKKELRDGLMKGFDEERIRVMKVIEYLLVNIDINKIELPYYKSYNYGEVPKYMKTKIKKHVNHFDINIFINKNKINKDYILKLFNINELNNKVVIYHILYKILDIYNHYNKALIYSIELLKKYPDLLKDDKYLDYLIKINPNQFVIKNDEIQILHLNEIKNAYSRKEETNKRNNIQMLIQNSSTIIFHKENKNYKILFK